MTLTYDTTADDMYSYQWQYKDDNGVWHDMTTDNPAMVIASQYPELTDGKDVRCLLLNSDGNLVNVSNALFVDPNDKDGDKPNVRATWNPATNTVSSLEIEITSTLENGSKAYVQCNTGSDWTKVGDGTSVKKNATVYVADPGASSVASPTLTTQWRGYVEKTTNQGAVQASISTGPVNIFDILEACKAGFNNWLTNNYVQDYGGTAMPETIEQLYGAFELYWSLPELTITTELQGGDLVLTAETEYEGTNVSYKWEYYDKETDAWIELKDENDQPVTGDTLNASNYSETKDDRISTVLDGGRDVRCKLYDGDTLKGIAVAEDVDPRAETYARAIDAINEGLNLTSYPVQVGGGGSYGSIYVDISIHGKKFDNYFYWDNLARKYGDNFADADAYADYLASVYLSYENPSEGLAAVKAIWDRYLFDMYDPLLDTGNFDCRYTYCNDNVETYPDRDYGDPSKSNIKDKNNTSFHGTAAANPLELEDLSYEFLEDGVDYANFITGVGKTANAVAAGDANSERKYLIDISADAQAKVVAPVAMVLQIQTSWQMFDLTHANAVKNDGDFVEVGAVANNYELANLFDIKNALLDFAEFMRVNFPGNNLLLGITETRHDASQSMFYGTDSSGKVMYVTNDYDTLYNGIVNWDTFGNCEHVHYSSTDLENAVKNLNSNLKGWKDVNGDPIEYDDIQKVAVIIGGPTENSNGTNGFGCTLPWDTFDDKITVTRADNTTATLPILNSVYGIRTNNGTLTSDLDGAVISWIDYAGNGKGGKGNMGDTPFNNGAGNTYTEERYIATTENAVFEALKDIALKEMAKKGIDLTAQDKFVDDVTVSDTVTDEFRLDPAVPFTATIYNSDQYGPEPQRGQVSSEVKINWQTGKVKLHEGPGGDIQGTRTETTDADGNKTITITFSEKTGGPGPGHDAGPFHTLTIVEKADKTTDISYDFGKVNNTKKCNLNFGIVARDDYLGSNNVFTNDGTPDLSYTHYKTDKQGHPTGEQEDYTRVGTDTPQVNVPIVFDTTDGGRKTTIVGATVDLGTDPALNSHVITEQIEDLVDNYDQINGTLTYTWVLPDGTEVDCGNVKVENGEVQGDFPSLDYDYLVSEENEKTLTLNVTFTPEDVDPNNKNFKPDGVTPVAVNEKTEPGRVWINAVGTDTKLNFYVRKVWEGNPGTDTVSYRISDGQNGYLAGNQSDGWDIVDNADDAGVYTVTAANGWQTKFVDVPPTKEVDSQTVILNYQPEEILPDGYEVTYSSTNQIDETWVGKLNVTLTNNSAKDIGADKIAYVHIKFTYGGQSYTRDFPVTLSGILAKNGGTVTQEGLMELPLDGSDQLLTPFEVESIFTYSKIDKGDYKDVNDIASASAERVLTGSTSTPVYVMTNAPTGVKVTIEKLVLGTETAKKFDMTAALDTGSFPAPGEDDCYTLDENGTAHFSLAHGESIELQVPENSEITVTETDHDGYNPMIKRDGTVVATGDTATMNVYNQPITITVVNTTGYELPSTGGIGALPIYTLGVLMMTGALMYGYLRRRRERGAE